MMNFHDHIFSIACKFTIEIIWFCIFSTVSILILPILLLVVSKSVIFSKISKSGMAVPVSHFDIAGLDMFNFLAKASCV